MKKILIVVTAFLLNISTLSAQKTGMSIQLGGILPSLQFGNQPALVIPGTNSFGSAGGAMFGASFGLKYTYRFDKTKMENSGLGIFVSADGIWNALQKDIRTKYDNVSCTKPMYVNVPVMLGISYTTQFSDVFGLWVEAGLGADLLFKTPEGWNDHTTEYKLSTEFAAEGGAGIILAKTITLGAHYYWLGTHDIRVKDATFSTANPLKVGVWAFKLGFHF